LAGALGFGEASLHLAEVEGSESRPSGGRDIALRIGSGSVSERRKDLFILREAALFLLGEDELVVEADLEDPLGAGNEFDRAEVVLKLAEDRVRQTGGPGTVVSGGAELDPDSHERTSYPAPEPLVILATLQQSERLAHSRCALEEEM
jgi:hypothetical protein